jgi:hypothetical protein
VAVGELAGAQHRVVQCLLRLVWDSKVNCETDCLTRRTAGCGPACPVVWEGRSREASPYPECAEHVRQLEGESPFHNLMEVIVSRRRESVMLYER